MQKKGGEVNRKKKKRRGETVGRVNFFATGITRVPGGGGGGGPPPPKSMGGGGFGVYGGAEDLDFNYDDYLFMILPPISILITVIYYHDIAPPRDSRGGG